MEGEQEGRDRQRHGMELGDVGPLQRREEEVDGGETESPKLGPHPDQPGASEGIFGDPVDGDGAEGQGQSLEPQQGTHIIPHEEDQRYRQEDRLEVIGEARPFGAIFFRFLQPVTVKRVPDRLVHVAQVGGVGEKGIVHGCGERAKVHGVEDDEQPEQHGGQ